MGTLSGSAVGLSASQLAMVDVIEREFLAAGYPLTLAAAAVVNAYAESRLNPLVSGDHGKSIGLFQLHERGAGAGMTVTARQDPTTNVRKIISVVAGAYGKAVRELALVVSSSADGIGRLAATFSTHVERPADKLGAEAARYALAFRIFPLGIKGSSTSIASAGSSPDSTRSSARYWWFAAAGVGLLVTTALIYRRSRGHSS